ncbi:hypothetical protein AAU61_08360 [Desulfocarbo indianensis]|nr:hypothetical protein AAU61_08360 [Desulfocarbo indianensis]
MSIVCFLPAGIPELDFLRQELGNAIAGRAVEYCQDLPQLLGRLRQPRPQVSLALLAAPDRAVLEGLLAERTAFAYLPVVLLMGDGGEAALAQAHLLAPRVLVDLGRDPGAIKDVICKILSRLRGFSPRTIYN